MDFNSSNRSLVANANISANNASDYRRAADHCVQCPVSNSIADISSVAHTNSVALTISYTNACPYSNASANRKADIGSIGYECRKLH